MNSSKIESLYTIERLIKNGKDTELTYSNSSIISGDTNVSFTYRNIYSRHIDVVKQVSVKVELNEDDLIKYKYNPHLLSFVLYKTTDLWFLLLFINNMTKISDFNRRIINVIDPNSLSVINDIHIIEREHIKKYLDFDKIREERRY